MAGLSRLGCRLSCRRAGGRISRPSMRIGFSIAWRKAIPFGRTLSTNRNFMCLSRHEVHCVLVEESPPLPVKLPVLASRRIGCCIQYTLNDYEREGLEHNVPPLAERIETFRLLSDFLGKEAVIWRFGPLLQTDTCR